MAGNLSPHFSWQEFVDRRADARRDPPCSLLCVLEALRFGIGRPLVVVSGYRTEATNRAVGGATSSQHLQAKAADIPSGLVRFEDAVRAGATGIGTKDGWVIHVDVRPGPVVRWEY